MFWQIRLLVIFVLLLSACERPAAQTMTRNLPPDPAAYPLPAEDIPSSVRESLHPWISGFIGLSTVEATQRLQERWASINHPALLELRRTLSEFEVRSVVDYGEGGLIYAVRRNASDEYIGNTFYLPGPLDSAILDIQLDAVSHSENATLREFLQHFAGLAEDTTIAGHFVYLNLPWETFTDSWNGSIEGFDEWRDSLMLYQARNGCTLLARQDGAVGWWVMQESLVAKEADTFEEWIWKFSDHRKLAWPYDPYGPADDAY